MASSFILNKPIDFNFRLNQPTTSGRHFAGHLHLPLIRNLKSAPVLAFYKLKKIRNPYDIPIGPALKDKQGDCDFSFSSLE